MKKTKEELIKIIEIQIAIREKSLFTLAKNIDKVASMYGLEVCKDEVKVSEAMLECYYDFISELKNLK